MGRWGTGIYQNDISEDVKDDYIAKLKSGKSDEDTLKEILSEYKNESEDVDCKYDFFLGLADIMWKKGRLTKEIKIKALQMIEEDKISERWQSEKIRKGRAKVLDKLKTKLNSQMPERKKVVVHKPYVLGWEEGDVFFFQIKNENRDKYITEEYDKCIGWYVLFYVDKITKKDWQVKGIYDEVAEVYFFLTKEKPKNVDEIQRSTPVCFLFFNDKNQYRAELFETSKRQRPNDLSFLGKYLSFTYPQNEFFQKRVFFWGLHERDILWGYSKQLKYERGL